MKNLLNAAYRPTRSIVLVTHDR